MDPNNLGAVVDQQEPSTPKAAEASRTKREGILGAIAGAAAVAGAFLPWAELQSVFGTLSLNGVGDGRDGIITAIAGGIAILVLVLALGTRMSFALAAICGGIIAGIGIYDFADLQEWASDVNAEGEAMARASIGMGLYLTIGAGVVLVILSVIGLIRSDRPGAASSAGSQ